METPNITFSGTGEIFIENPDRQMVIFKVAGKEIRVCIRNDKLQISGDKEIIIAPNASNNITIY